MLCHIIWRGLFPSSFMRKNARDKHPFSHLSCRFHSVTSLPMKYPVTAAAVAMPNVSNAPRRMLDLATMLHATPSSSRRMAVILIETMRAVERREEGKGDECCQEVGEEHPEGLHERAPLVIPGDLQLEGTSVHHIARSGATSGMIKKKVVPSPSPDSNESGPPAYGERFRPLHAHMVILIEGGKSRLPGSLRGTKAPEQELRCNRCHSRYRLRDYRSGLQQQPPIAQRWPGVPERSIRGSHHRYTTHRLRYCS
jgi:hypothetical protein